MADDSDLISGAGILLRIAAACFGLTIAIFIACGFKLHVDGHITAFLRIFLFAFGILYLVREIAFTRKPRLIVAGVFSYMVICACGLMLAFCAATTVLPYQDGAMLYLDRLLGYDWREYGYFVHERPWLSHVLGAAYFSIDWQPLIIIIVLSCRGEARRLIGYQLSTIIALLLTAMIFAFIPVTTAWTHGSPADVRDALYLGMNDSWVDELERIRSGELRSIFWGVKGAIVGFPSFHCAAALLNVWFLWRDRPYWIYGVPLNVLMIAATLTVGGHYLVDLLAGTLVAVTSIALGSAASHLDWRRRSRGGAKTRSSGSKVGSVNVSPALQ